MEPMQTNNNLLPLPDIAGNSDPEKYNSALASLCGEEKNCNGSTALCLDINMMDQKLKPIEQQLQYLLNKADEFQAHLSHRRDNLQKEDFAQVVHAFLRTCQPYFSYLEDTARTSLPQRSLLPTHICTRLLFFSQQLCARLEKLLHQYASFDFISLEEVESFSISHFFIGECWMDSVRLSIFRYSRPAPYLAGFDTGLYKRMRWNVERPRQRPAEERENEVQGQEHEIVEVKERHIDTEYYFLCYQDVPEQPVDRDCGDNEEETFATGKVVRMWSIGQWVQTHPDPEAEDLLIWLLYRVPQAQYHMMLCLGQEEPSTCHATDSLLRALCFQPSPVESSCPEIA
ncbi:hypothetical protein DPEC_G00175440 [Dallia pectoralis]|uniref:Uncharacterized protein n=1 Tax=Dallia pectoralis TaxID=75939 RepID=A0ACC2GES9_DALPE|nr:hypothetical protein DPEC_G00175440 [Dallia pectoralis]